MKTSFASQDRSSAGHALLIVLCITAASMIVLAATMNRTVGNSNLNARNNQYVAGLYAAEAATEKVFGMMKTDFLAGNLTAITNHLGQYQGAIPLGSENAYWNQYQFSDGQGHLNSNYVACTMSAYQLSTNWGLLPSQYSGLYGWTNSWRIVSNVKQISHTTYSITNACQLDVDMDLIPVFQFAIFYNGLLEFTWCAPLTVNGRTHANGSIYTGTIDQLTFNNLVTTTGTLASPAWDGHSTSDYTVAAKYNAGYSTNANSLNLPIGNTNANSIIQMPPPGGDTNASLAQQRYCNKADLILLVSNSTVTLTLQNSYLDSQPTNITAYYYPTNYSWTNPAAYSQVTNNFPFLNVTNFYGTNGVSTNYFTDQRESAQVKVTDIDVGVLKSWLVTNKTVAAKFPNTAGVYNLNTVPNILYAADNRSTTSGQLTAVRLSDAQTIPTNLVNIAGNNQPSGFTVATPNPLYIEGYYNCPNSTYLGTTNTTTDYPASLASDALTILSPNWVDSQSKIALGGSGKNVAVSDTVNAAILTGIVPSTGSGSSQFSGGVMNLPRLLEDWGNGGSVTLTLNTSIVNLFNSVRATNQFQNPGVYYYAPTRQFTFDANFLNYTKQPPGTPMLGAALRAKWTVPPPNTVTYAGN
ncbi:MAG: hypothetical protein ACLQU3_23925 [Limisphaerales bacterium]